MPSEQTVTTHRYGAVAEIVIDHPPVNAISVDIYAALTAAAEACCEDEDVKVVLVRSARESVFSAGADVRELASIAGNRLADERRQRAARRAYEALLDVQQPTVAVLNGPALGAGAVIAACCDIRIAAESAQIGLPELSVARCGGARHLRSLLPEGVVRFMLFTGQSLNASEALALGLYSKVVPAGAELAAARAVAQQIATRSRFALRLAKEALVLTETMPLRAGYRLEQRYSVTLGSTHDGGEGSVAFVEHREPQWSDK